MTKQGYTHLKVVVDRSGSMSGYEQDMIGGLNSLFEEQSKQEGACLVDYSWFDVEYETLFEDKYAGQASARLQPRGATALLDAIGRAVTEFGEKLAALDEDARPEHVILVVVTDGYENSSTEWTRDQVKELLERQQNEWNWTVLFLGANMDAVAEGATFGTKSGNSLTYAQGNENIAFAAASAAVSQTRTTGTFRGYSDSDRDAAVKS